MKKCIYSLYLMGSVLISTAALMADEVHEWGPMTNNLQMSIALAGGTNVTVGKDFALAISFRTASSNESTIAYEFHGTIWDPSYSFQITSPSGRDVSPDTSKLLPPNSGRALPIRPNEIASIHFDLGQLCRLNEIGTYKIVATKKKLFSGGDKPTTLTSNPLFIKVVPEKE